MLQRIQKGGIALAAFANPNAPTGIAESEKDILDFASRNPSLTLVDEAYADFGNVSVFKNAGTSSYPRLLVSGTASKALSLAGARIGWLCAEESLIAELEKIKDSYNVSRLAQAAALAAVLDKTEFEKRRDEIVNNRNFLTEGLGRLGFETLPSSTNFIFTRPPADLRTLSQRGETAAGAYYRLLLEKKILVRYWSSEKLKEWIRITIGTRADMEKLLSTTDSIVSLAKGELISSQ
jgi:histidinol-phosphate aminotransferase